MRAEERVAANIPAVTIGDHRDTSAITYEDKQCRELKEGAKREKQNVFHKRL